MSSHLPSPAAAPDAVRGDEVLVTKTEFRLLCVLAENPSGVFSREQLLEKVWDYDYFGDGRLVDVHVRRLRMKIELDPANPRHVVTVRGLGYRLTPLAPTDRLEQREFDVAIWHGLDQWKDFDGQRIL